MKDKINSSDLVDVDMSQTSESLDLMQCIIDAVTPSCAEGTVPQEHLATMVDHTQIEIVEDSENVFSLIVREIKKAKKQILIQAFIWIPTTQIVKDIKDALCSITEEVEVFLLVDQLTRFARAFFLKEIPPRKPAHDLVSLGLDGLPDNIKLHIGNYRHTSLASNHNKAILIDDNLILTGANFQPNNYGPHRFNDAAMLIPKAAATFAYDDFMAMWALRTNISEENITPVLPVSEETIDKTDMTNLCSMIYATNRLERRLAVHPFHASELPQTPLNNAYLAAINHARETISIAVPNLNSPEIMQVLADFINERSGHVELLLSKNFNNFREKMYGGTNQSTVEKLVAMIDEEKQDNLQIRWYHRGNREPCDHRPDVNHMKFMAIDNQVVIYGSANLDYISLHNCHETNIVIDSPEFTQRAKATLFSPLFEKALPAMTRNRRNCCLM